MPEHCSAVILAGGFSSRMHFPKAYLLYKGSTFAENIIDSYRMAGIRDIIIVMNYRLCSNEWMTFLQPLREKATIIENHQPEWGRAYSLLLGLNNVMHSDYCFMQNVDSPFVDKELINTLYSHRNTNGITKPSFLGKSGHPVLLAKGIMRDLIRTNHSDVQLRELFSKYPETRVEVPDESVLYNINTQEDYFRFLKLQPHEGSV